MHIVNICKEDYDVYIGRAGAGQLFRESHSATSRRSQRCHLKNLETIFITDSQRIRSSRNALVH